MTGRLPRTRNEPSRFPAALRRQAAFTLVEVLLALALTTVLIGLTGSIAVNSLRTRRYAQGVVRQLDREAYVLARIAEDLADLQCGLPGDASAISVFGTPRQVLQLSVLTAVPSVGYSLHLIRRPATVRYRLVGDRHESAGLRLVRETIDRTRVSARPVRETLSRGLESFRVEVLCDDQWTRSYPENDDETTGPLAVRVTCQWGGAEQEVTRVFLVPGES